MGGVGPTCMQSVIEKRGKVRHYIYCQKRCTAPTLILADPYRELKRSARDSGRLSCNLLRRTYCSGGSLFSAILFSTARRSRPLPSPECPPRRSRSSIKSKYWFWSPADVGTHLFLFFIFQRYASQKLTPTILNNS